MNKSLKLFLVFGLSIFLNYGASGGGPSDALAKAIAFYNANKKPDLDLVSYPIVQTDVRKFLLLVHPDKQKSVFPSELFATESQEKQIKDILTEGIQVLNQLKETLPEEAPSVPRTAPAASAAPRTTQAAGAAAPAMKVHLIPKPSDKEMKDAADIIKKELKRIGTERVLRFWTNKGFLRNLDYNVYSPLVPGTMHHAVETLKHPDITDAEFAILFGNKLEMTREEYDEFLRQQRERLSKQ